MEKQEIKLSQMPKNKENPFLKQAIEEVQKNTIRKFVNSSGADRKAVLNMVDGETGEVLQTSFVRQILVDEDQFTKIYKKQVEALFDLSKAGIRVFGYILQCMRPSKDMVIVNIQECMDFCHYSGKASVYRGIAELCQAGIIARAWSDCLFFVNPMILFNGNRVTFINDYIKKDNEDTKAIQQQKLTEEHKQLALDIEEFEKNT